MKLIWVFAVVVACVAHNIEAQTCGTTEKPCLAVQCTSSAACAANAGNDMRCRCVNFVCACTEPCGGGCLTTDQCKDWAGNDPNCICTWAFKCEVKSAQHLQSSSDSFVNMMKTVAMIKMSQERREELQKVQD